MAGPMNTKTFFQSQTKVVQKTYTRGMQEVPSLFSELFNDYENDMKRSYMTLIPYAPLGQAQLKTEGTVPAYDQAIEGPPTTVTFSTYGLGYTYTKEAGIEDAMNALAELPHMLTYSMQVTYDYLIWNILNIAFSGTATLADGLSLCNAAHPLVKIPSSTYSNTGGTVALTPEALVAADISLLTLPNDAGLPASVTPQFIVFPPTLSKVVEEINGSPLAPYTSDNRINVQQGKKVSICSRYLTSNTAFFVTGAKGRLGLNSHSMFYSFKYRDDQNAWVDPATQNFNHTAESRLAFSTVDARGVWGSQGS